jgi:hypothetical protein
MKENFSEAGAMRLAKTIREYWAARGATPSVFVAVDVGHFRENSASSIFVVRSDMLNGYPQGGLNP